MSQYRFRIARSTDDEALRQRMASDIMEGPIAVSFRREPSYFRACAVQGEQAQIIVCETANKQLVGLGARFTMRAFVNGTLQRIGYLSDLRADIQVRGATLLARGYRYLHELHRQDPVPFYSTMILSGNVQAHRVLTSARVGLPTYHGLGKVLTPALHLDRAKAAPSSRAWRVTTGQASDMAKVMAFIRQQFSHKQLARTFDHDDLGKPALAGLQPQDFYILRSGKRMLACAGCWDQTNFRQTHVETYRGALRWLRPIYNLGARVSALKPLPACGRPVPYFYLSFIAVHDNDPELLAHLLRHIYRDRRRGSWHYMVVSLHEQDPLVSALSGYRHIHAAGCLFVVHYSDGAQAVTLLDGRVPYVDAAWL